MITAWGFNPGKGFTPEMLISDMNTYGYKGAAFQANEGGWPAAFELAREKGFSCQLWASCSQIDPQVFWALIGDYDPDRVIVQIETMQELIDFRYHVSRGVFHYKPVDAFIIGPVYLLASYFGTELKALGVRRTWCEVYLQDNRDEGMLYNAAEWWNCPAPRPCFGMYNQIPRSAYNLNAWPDKWYSVGGYKYSTWLWEQKNMG